MSTIDTNKITPKQWEVINKHKAEAMANWCKDYPDESLVKNAKAMYLHIDKAEPVVIICDSPAECLAKSAYWSMYWEGKTEPDAFDEKQMIKESATIDCEKAKKDYEAKRGSVISLPFSAGQWWRAWCKWYLGAKEAYDTCLIEQNGELVKDENLKFDDSNLDLFYNFNETCSTWVAHEKVIFVSRNPVIMELEDNELHCETGPAIKYRDGWERWVINGVQVTKQIVESPETLTIEQMRGERNEEVRRIMISQHGWDKFLLAVGAEVIDTQHHEWMETLMRCDDGYTVLCTYDPSTGRPYSLEVSEDCTTCQEAQAYLAGFEDAFQGYDMETEYKYPVGRT